MTSAIAFLVCRWVSLETAKHSTIRIVKLTNVPPTMVGTPKLLGSARQVSFESVGLPKFLSKEAISEIAVQVGSIDTKGDKVWRVEACWDDMPFAARVRIGKASVFLVKDASESWRVQKVIYVER
jgi:hypothetical protein